ncbi:hypothetical protein BV25DRAFT_1543581 [Artomyces pyxidatus]|uniref:Uncharacterized protein n=1 Tax=Artomyces pyxidatus TaxID=48021 RepID=A0ACB8SLY6_9AGAM|nr:hypothetical protein BV25DRAFT_1543581 [Artomyces pyxidatus]
MVLLHRWDGDAVVGGCLWVLDTRPAVSTSCCTHLVHLVRSFVLVDSPPTPSYPLRQAIQYTEPMQSNVKAPTLVHDNGASQYPCESEPRRSTANLHTQPGFACPRPSPAPRRRAPDSPAPCRAALPCHCASRSHQICASGYCACTPGPSSSSVRTGLASISPSQPLTLELPPRHRYLWAPVYDEYTPPRNKSARWRHVSLTCRTRPTVPGACRSAHVPRPLPSRTSLGKTPVTSRGYFYLRYAASFTGTQTLSRIYLKTSALSIFPRSRPARRAASSSLPRAFSAA